MTLTDTATTRTKKLRRAALLKRIAIITLLLNIFTMAASKLIYPFIYTTLIPTPKYEWPRFPISDIALCSVFVAVLATSMIGGAIETEQRERALNNDNLSNSQAITQSALRLTAWFIASLCSAVVMVIITKMTQQFMGL